LNLIANHFHEIFRHRRRQIERVGGSEQIHKQIVEVLDSFRRLDDNRSLRALEDINEAV
jgi:hypothetical protein